MPRIHPDLQVIPHPHLEGPQSSSKPWLSDGLQKPRASSPTFSRFCASCRNGMPQTSLDSGSGEAAPQPWSSGPSRRLCNRIQRDILTATTSPSTNRARLMANEHKRAEQTIKLVPGREALGRAEKSENTNKAVKKRVQSTTARALQQSRKQTTKKLNGMGCAEIGEQKQRQKQ